MEFIIYLLIQLGILLGNPTQNQERSTSPVQEQSQPMQMKSSTTTTTTDDSDFKKGGSGTWGDNG